MAFAYCGMVQVRNAESRFLSGRVRKKIIRAFVATFLATNTRISVAPRYRLFALKSKSAGKEQPILFLKFKKNEQKEE